MNKLNSKITKRDQDFAMWYTDIIKASRLCSYSSIKGFIILEPLGYAIWEEAQKILNKMFKETGHFNCYLPLLIPEDLLNKEKDLVEGFAPEVAWVTEGGSKKLDQRFCIRPTSETLFCEYFRSIIESYKDLPVKLNQWCSVVRWEKETRPFLRGREFLWQEGHTIHETQEEGEKETLLMLKIYEKFLKEYLAIPVIIGKKTESEKFAGALYTYTTEALMYNGVALQMATSHFFEQKFTKAYDIKFKNKNNEYVYPYQTSWGITTRIIGGIIMVHADDRGLVLPPKIAPTKIDIIPIGTSLELDNYLEKIKSLLDSNNLSYYIDQTNKNPGYKFAESEVKGTPLRLEVGDRDLKEGFITLVRRDTYEKIHFKIDDNIIDEIKLLLDKIQENLYEMALKRREEKTYHATSFQEVKDIIESKGPGFIHACWCGKKECEEKMKEINGIKSRCIPFEENLFSDHCLVCGEKAKYEVIWGIQY